MKKIEAIIRRSRYRAIKDALHEVGVIFFSHWDATGLGNEDTGHVYRGINYSTNDIQRRILSIVVNDDFVDPTIEIIIEKTKTGEVGDGKIFVTDVSQAYRIRTGESGNDTLK